MFKFWVLAVKFGHQNITVNNVIARTPEQAIKSKFWDRVKPASPFKFDFCTQESTENGYRYWLRTY